MTKQDSELRQIKLTFIEPLLGTLAGDKEIAKEFILANNPAGDTAEEEQAHRDPRELLEKASSIFARTADGKPMLWNYQMKGFFKDACSALRRATVKLGEKSRELKAHKKVIDGCIFVSPRQIPLQVVGELFWLERPVRAQTAQGERIALLRSEAVPGGSSLICQVKMLDTDLWSVLEDWLTYGKDRGLGQWRNASYGSFEWAYA